MKHTHNITWPKCQGGYQAVLSTFYTLVNELLTLVRCVRPFCSFCDYCVVAEPLSAQTVWNPSGDDKLNQKQSEDFMVDNTRRLKFRHVVTFTALGAQLIWFAVCAHTHRSVHILFSLVVVVYKCHSIVSLMVHCRETKQREALYIYKR